MNCGRTLAEPTLVTLDGKAAKFESGSIAIGHGAALVPYGVQATLTPTMLDHNRIRLEVTASLRARARGM